MEARNENQNVSVTFTYDEVIVLLEWLSYFNEQKPSFQDQSEQRILWELEGALEKHFPDIFSENYQEILLKARNRIRDKE